MTCKCTMNIIRMGSKIISKSTIKYLKSTIKSIEKGFTMSSAVNDIERYCMIFEDRQSVEISTKNPQDVEILRVPMELIVGVEPTTFSLRMRCSAIKLYQHIDNTAMRCSAIKHLSEELADGDQDYLPYGKAVII